MTKSTGTHSSASENTAESATVTEPASAKISAADKQRSGARRARVRIPGVRMPSLRAVSGVAAFSLCFGALVAPAAYVVDSPGPLFNVLGTHQNEQIIRVQGARTGGSGELNMTTVSVAGGPYTQISGVEAFTAWLHRAENGTGYDQVAVPTEALYPHVTQEQAQSASGAQMADSQTQAAVAAARYLGKPVTEKTLVRAVVSDGASAGVLQPGDRLLQVGDKTISTLSDVSAAVQASEGRELVVRFEREGAQHSVQLTARKGTVNTDSGAQERWLLGISLAQDYELPFSIEYSLDGIGGPSAGMMLTLGIIDRLGDTSLLSESGEGNRNIIAGTGTINAAGQVGPIGGIRFKIRASGAHGVPYFLAPADNCADIVRAKRQDPDFDAYFVDGRRAGQMRIVPVKTIDDAVAALETIRSGGVDSLPTCS
ncbi:MAG: PDZ domain-containing protein [Rothia sp. (in: high G+C Gram-positive bacteria)]|uniref:YlbL family protein n=1 Tax=Rothia sp. (in: high G+C Gram-positive bacteria) TaxID=1885016 RepID=UPI0026E06037|nr:PDZ domain-containing protein [Rothia sp. (in: high G+C Gram-positive bacteria)]MDO5751053.1 PDZ domain-containing protein [Rothia sp. (in: high G+C Gram-positive bacteria)]